MLCDSAVTNVLSCIGPTYPSATLTPYQGVTATVNFNRALSRSYASDATDVSHGHSTSSPSAVVLYRGRGIKVFRLLVRFKIFQLTAVAALAVPITTLFNSGELGTVQSVVAAALLIGSGAASSALWYYSRRYVGELSLVKYPTAQEMETTAQEEIKVRFSVLDFWGNREDIDVPIVDVMPPLAGLSPHAATALAAEAVLPLTVHGDRKYILSLRYGHVIDGKKLRALLDGSLQSRKFI